MMTNQTKRIIHLIDKIYRQTLINRQYKTNQDLKISIKEFKARQDLSQSKINTEISITNQKKNNQGIIEELPLNLAKNQILQYQYIQGPSKKSKKTNSHQFQLLRLSQILVDLLLQTQLKTLPEDHLPKEKRKNSKILTFTNPNGTTLNNFKIRNKPLKTNRPLPKTRQFPCITLRRITNPAKTLQN